jgi:Tfp pilus assembly protein PilN
MINLLPPEEKKALLAEKARRLIIVLGLVVLLSLFCLIIILISLKIYLLIQIDAQKNILEAARSQTENLEAQAIQEKTEDFNKKLSRIGDFYQQKANLGEIIEELAQTIPGRIYLVDLSYSKNTNQIILAGFSPSRDLLVQLKKNLEEEEKFQKVYFPPSSWIEAANIDFGGVKINISK